ncbi:hypothetical protein OSTOST_24068, partial [Ostertagia ostertagi]
NVVEGVVHMANSVAVCSEPEQLLQIFRRMLSPELYSAIIQRLPESFASVPALLVEAMSTARPQLPEQLPKAIIPLQSKCQPSSRQMEWDLVEPEKCASISNWKKSRHRINFPKLLIRE